MVTPSPVRQFHTMLEEDRLFRCLEGSPRVTFNATIPSNGGISEATFHSDAPSFGLETLSSPDE